MFIRFANTDGEVFINNTSTSNSSANSRNSQNDFYANTNVGIQNLGSILTFDDGMIIIDRYPHHNQTMLNIDDLINALKRLILQLYSTQIANIDIFLPKMTNSMFDESVCQEKFATLDLTTQLTNNKLYACNQSFVGFTLKNITDTSKDTYKLQACRRYNQQMNSDGFDVDTEEFQQPDDTTINEMQLNDSRIIEYKINLYFV